MTIIRLLLVKEIVFFSDFLCLYIRGFFVNKSRAFVYLFLVRR